MGQAGQPVAAAGPWKEPGTLDKPDSDSSKSRFPQLLGVKSFKYLRRYQNDVLNVSSSTYESSDADDPLTRNDVFWMCGNVGEFSHLPLTQSNTYA